MKNELKIISIVGVAAVLAGCEPAPVDPGLTSYAEVNDAMVAMAETYLDGDGHLLGTVTATPSDNVPIAGEATYNGFIGGDVLGSGLDGRNLVGELTLTADFAGNDISGSATNFYDDNDAQYTGTLLISGDNTIDTISDPEEVSPNLDGVLSDGVLDHTFDIALDGWFIGAVSPDAVGGLADGTVTTDSGGPDEDIGLFTGVFIAEQ